MHFGLLLVALVAQAALSLQAAPTRAAPFNSSHLPPPPQLQSPKASMSNRHNNVGERKKISSAHRFAIGPLPPDAPKIKSAWIENLYPESNGFQFFQEEYVIHLQHIAIQKDTIHVFCGSECENATAMLLQDSNAVFLPHDSVPSEEKTASNRARSHVPYYGFVKIPLQEDGHTFFLRVALVQSQTPHSSQCLSYVEHSTALINVFVSKNFAEVIFQTALPYYRALQDISHRLFELKQQLRKSSWRNQGNSPTSSYYAQQSVHAQGFKNKGSNSSDAGARNHQAFDHDNEDIENDGQDQNTNHDLFIPTVMLLRQESTYKSPQFLLPILRTFSFQNEVRYFSDQKSNSKSTLSPRSPPQISSVGEHPRFKNSTWTACFQHLFIVKHDPHYIYRHPSPTRSWNSSTSGTEYKDSTPPILSHLVRNFSCILSNSFLVNSETGSNEEDFPTARNFSTTRRIRLGTKDSVFNGSETRSARDQEPPRSASFDQSAPKSRSGLEHHVKFSFGHRISLLCDDSKYFLTNNERSKKRRVVFVSRPRQENNHEKSTRIYARSILNEASLISYLKQRLSHIAEVESYSFERMSLKLQFSVLKNTDVLIATHGAGCIHSLFLSPGKSFVQISPFLILHELFPKLALANGVRSFDYFSTNISNSVFYIHSFPEKCKQAIVATQRAEIHTGANSSFDSSISSKSTNDSEQLNFPEGRALAKGLTASLDEGVLGSNYAKWNEFMLTHPLDCVANSYYWKQQDIAVEPEAISAILNRIF